MSDFVRTGDDDSSSHKRKMAIVVGLSVAGGIFVLAVTSTIVFVLVRRSRKLDGYTTINEGPSPSLPNIHIVY